MKGSFEVIMRKFAFMDRRQLIVIFSYSSGGFRCLNLILSKMDGPASIKMYTHPFIDHIWVPN